MLNRALEAPRGGEEETDRSARPGIPVDLHRLLRVVRRGRYWLLGVAVIGSAVGLIVGKYAVHHTYEATASLRYEGRPGMQPHEAQGALPPLVSITHSEPIMMALRERMGLGEASIEAMRRMVQIESDAGSGFVRFTTTGDSPERAARMANTLVTLFLEHHRARRADDLRRDVASFDERITAAQRELAGARRRYDAFREQNRITDLSAEQEQAITRAADLRSQADLASAEIRSLEARVAQLTSAIASTPRMQAMGTGDSDQARRLGELRSRLQEARSAYSDEHPHVQALQRQVASLERGGARGGSSTRMGVSTLHEQLRSNLSDARTELEATRRRQQSLEQLAAEAQTRTNRFSGIEGRAATLLAQVNVKQALLNSLNEQKARAQDEQRDVQTGFRTVARAQPPESAVRSKRKIVVAAAIPAALVSLLLGLLLFRELRGLRVQTPAEVAWWGDGPVIGTTTWPRDPRALIDLIADMDDFAPEARGTILVVGSTEAERDLAAEVAAQLNHDWSTTTLLDVPILGALPPSGTPSSPMDPFGDRGGGSDALVLARGPHTYEVERFDAASEVSAYAASPARDLDDPSERLICTAWNGPAHGQALRRAARLADRVLVVVTSDRLSASELALMKTRLGRRGGVGYVVVEVSDDVARLPDRAGSLEEFWDGASPR